MLSSLPRRVRAATRLAVALAALGGAAACNDSTGPDNDVDIESVRLTVTPAGGAPTTYTVTANTGTTVTVPLRVGANTIVAQPIGDDGRVSDEADEFELRLLNLPAGVTATRNRLTNTVTATAAVAATLVSAEMFHVTENHEDYTANFRITVAP